MITQGKFKVQGSESKPFYQFLLENYLRIKAEFYQTDQAAKTNEMFGYLVNRVRPISEPLITSVTDNKIFSRRPSQQPETGTITQLISEYVTHIGGLEEHLAKHEFITGKYMTYVDIAMFIEIDTIKTIYGSMSLP